MWADFKSRCVFIERNKESNVKRELFMVLECIRIILNGNFSQVFVYCDKEWR